MKTCRGFEVKHFKDAYGTDCSIQESSAVGSYIWLGVHEPQVKIMFKDAQVIKEIEIKKDDPATNEYGWCTLIMPKEALIDSRMHLNREQAKKLIKELRYFVKHGVLEPEEEK